MNRRNNLHLAYQYLTKRPQFSVQFGHIANDVQYFAFSSFNDFRFSLVRQQSNIYIYICVCVCVCIKKLYIFLFKKQDIRQQLLKFI